MADPVPPLAVEGGEAVEGLTAGGAGTAATGPPGPGNTMMITDRAWAMAFMAAAACLAPARSSPFSGTGGGQGWLLAQGEGVVAIHEPASRGRW